MSCLMLDDLPLSEQIAIELAWASKLSAKTRAVLNVLDSTPEPAVTPCTASTPLAGGESTSSYAAESFA